MEQDYASSHPIVIFVPWLLDASLPVGPLLLIRTFIDPLDLRHIRLLFGICSWLWGQRYMALKWYVAEIHGRWIFDHKSEYNLYMITSNYKPWTYHMYELYKQWTYHRYELFVLWGGVAGQWLNSWFGSWHHQ